MGSSHCSRLVLRSFIQIMVLAAASRSSTPDSTRSFINSSLSARQNACSQETGVRKTFCSQFLAPRNQQLFAQYQALREGCTWKPLDLSHKSLRFMYRWYANDLEYTEGRESFVMNWDSEVKHKHETKRAISTVTLQTCQVEVKQGALEGVWVFDRFGPMAGHGGNDWHQFMWALNLPGRADWLDVIHDNMHVTGHYLSTVDASGIPIGHPPVHMHHSHLNPEGCWYNADGKAPRTNVDLEEVQADKSVLGQTHGDSPCTEQEGGMACLLNVLPEGYGYGRGVMNRMCIDGELNDVRQPNSSLLEFYFEVGLRFQSPRPQQLSFLSIGNPHYMNSACDGCGQWNKNGVYFFQPRLQNAIEYFQVTA